MTACPGRHSDDDTEGVPVWCPGHRKRIVAAITAMPRWTLWLYEEAALRTNTQGERTGKTPKFADSPSPSAALDTIDDLAQWLNGLVIVVAGHLHHVGPEIDTATGVPHLTASIRLGSAYLLAQADGWLDDPNVDYQFGIEAMQLERIIVWCRRDNPINKLPAACGDCNRSTLVRHNGASHVRCTHCGRIWHEDEYDRMVRVALS